MALSQKEALDIIHSGDWCSLSFITADVKKGSGGKVIHLQKARLCKSRPGSSASAVLASHDHGVKRSPNHEMHFTRNLELPNKQIRKIHPSLIFSINQQPVI